MLSSRLLPLLPAVALLVFGGCSSDTESSLNPDPELEAKLDLVTGCMPGHIEKLNALLAFSETWRLNDGGNPTDPVELDWSYDGTTITYSVDLAAFRIFGTIGFYAPDGTAQSLTLSNTSLSQAIDDAATELRNTFPGGGTFMVGDWTLEGVPTPATVSSTGLTSSPAAFTGLIGGSANQNELAELRTTIGTGSVSGGVPAVQACQIEVVGTETCTFVFEMPSLVTDGSPSQEYPIGSIDYSLQNTGATTSVAGTLVMDGSVLARLNVNDFPGYFEINLETYAVNHRP